MKNLENEDLKWLGIDFDNTIAYSEYPTFEIKDPVPGAIEALQRLVGDGWKIWIHTSRPSVDYIKIEDWCKKHGVSIKGIVTGKPLFRHYIDDRAIEFKGDWDEVLKKVGSFNPFPEGNPAEELAIHSDE